MYPILIEIDSLGFTLRSYPTFILLAVVTSLWLGPLWAARLEGLDRRRTFVALVLIGFAVFTGARLHFILTHPSLLRGGLLDIFRVWSGGIHAGGAIAFFAFSAPVVARWFRIPIGKLADAFAPTLGVGIAVARLGCFLQGCCFGTVCRWPWGISFPKEAYIYHFHRSLGVLPPDATQTAPIHPLQLYFAGMGLLVTGAALWLHPRKRYDGQVALVALLVYSAGSAVLEFFRADYYPQVYWGPLPQLEWVALALTAASLAALAVAELRHRHRSSGRPTVAAGARPILPRTRS